MDYKVVVTRDAEEDLERFIKYLIIGKESMPAAENVLNDYDATIESLRHVAGSLKLCDNPRLRQLEYRRINFLTHRYFMLYRVVDNVVFVDNIFHELQDDKNIHIEEKLLFTQGQNQIIIQSDNAVFKRINISIMGIEVSDFE